MRSLALTCALLLLACTPPPNVVPARSVEPTAAPTAAGIGGTPMHSVAMTNGLSIDLPSSWSVDGEAFVNRATQRELIAANGDIASLPTLAGNGDIDAGALAPGRFVLEIESFCRFSCQGPTSETALPLDWNDAAALPPQSLAAGHHQAAVSYRWFDTAAFLVARWADPAAADIALMPAIAKSLRPTSPVPMHGGYLGWSAVAPLADIPVGTVRWEPLPAGAVVGQDARTYDVAAFFVVRGKRSVYSFVSVPLNDERCVIYYDGASDHFRCGVDSRVYEWTRFGTYLGPEPQSNLIQHRVMVREGIVWVQFLRDTLLEPSVPDEAAEY